MVESLRLSLDPKSSEDNLDGRRGRSHVLAVCFFIAVAYSFLSLTDEATLGVIGVGVGVGDELELELDESLDDDYYFVL